MRILVTGGAGFVGSSLAVRLKQDHPSAEVCAFDNLRRRGSELALERLQAKDIGFCHGDVRSSGDLAAAGRFDLLVECSAEPSVQAGYGSTPYYVVETNLLGTVNCLEAARRNDADFIFLSTSRVYPIDRLRALPLERRGQRLELSAGPSGPGWSANGITAEFPLAGHRSMYGATKLASELLIEEYRAMYGLRAIVNRCGVIAGPWQMGKVDQGFIALWAARHLFGGPLGYIGFGGEGLQVRDVLHVQDLADLVSMQTRDVSRYDGKLLNIGGGRDRSVSLLELTGLCRERTGREIPLTHTPATSPADIPYYVTDNSPVSALSGWTPQRSLSTLLDDVFTWLRANAAMLEPVFSASSGMRAFAS